jgi:hypothetical protein
LLGLETVFLVGMAAQFGRRNLSGGGQLFERFDQALDGLSIPEVRDGFDDLPVLVGEDAVEAGEEIEPVTECESVPVPTGEDPAKEGAEETKRSSAALGDPTRGKEEEA